MKKTGKQHVSGWWCGACGIPYDWRKPNRLLALQIGDTAYEQVCFLAYSAPSGECDNMICVLKLVTNLVNGNELDVKAKGLTEDRREKSWRKRYLSGQHQSMKSPWVSSGSLKKCRNWFYQDLAEKTKTQW